MQPSFFLDVKQYLEYSVSDFSTFLEKYQGKKKVGDVTLAELCAVEGAPNGLYFFFDDEDVLWYVGKATSRSFIERISSHFDQREDAWFATLPRKIKAICEIAQYRDAHALALTLRLVILGIQEKERSIRLETTFRSCLGPKLNSNQKHKSDCEKKLRDV